MCEASDIDYSEITMTDLSKRYKGVVSFLLNRNFVIKSNIVVSPRSVTIYLSIYIYIYECVCVCVCMLK